MFDLVVRLEGDLVDFHGWDQFDQFMAKLVELEQGPIYLDMMKVNRISSNYIGSIISNYKNAQKMGLDMALINVRPKLMELFEVLSLKDILNIKPA